MYDFQASIPTRDLREGDFLYVIQPAILRGPRGGKYRFPGVRVDSKIQGLDTSTGRLTIRPATGPAFTLPGNSHQLTSAIIRRRDSDDVTAA